MSRNTSTQVSPSEDVISEEGLTFTELADELTSRYQAGDRKAKAQVRSEVKSLMSDAAEARDVEQWLAWQEFEKGLAPAGPVKVELDYQHLVYVEVQALLAAAEGLATGVIRPAGLPEDFVYDGGDNQDHPSSEEAILASVTRITKGLKFGTSTKAPKGDITAHIEQVFESLESGTFLTEREIQCASSDAYPEGTPKGGNVHANLFGSDDKIKAWTTRGIIPTVGSGSQPAGATKA